jgi:hypothetical protein
MWVVTINRHLSSIGASPAIGANDKYKKLSAGTATTIPVVDVSGTLYYNALVSIGSIISVGGGEPYLQQFVRSQVFVTGLTIGQTLQFDQQCQRLLGVFKV